MPNREINIITCDINDDIGNSYKIEYGSQLMEQNKPTLNDEPVVILNRIRDTPDWGIDHNVNIQLSNGEEKIVNLRDLDFLFYLT
jgi:hypothetical protein